MTEPLAPAEELGEIRRYADAAEFWRVAEPVVRGEPVLLSVLASTVDGCRRGGVPDASFFVVKRPGRPPFLAMHTPPHFFHLPLADPEAASALARFVFAEGLRPAGAGGQADSVDAFSDVWCGRTGRGRRAVMQMGIYDLPRPPRLQWPVSGEARVAEGVDAPLVDAWLAAFAAETGVPSTTSALSLPDGRVWLWCDPEPVAMACRTVPAGGVARVSYVYTPPDARGHGYASAVTAAVSAALLDAGLRCMLYTDLANPTSNGIYAALGYRRLAESVDVEFTA
ncbi:MAG: GNAT family N-acetyltransferase [Propionicimonas sp.]|uniref:GNAT family N-acetyltransferase n=1 Tax=Propionicimonas sp. TaxID=1955623 RepID=UPI003D1158CA